VRKKKEEAQPVEFFEGRLVEHLMELERRIMASIADVQAKVDAQSDQVTAVLQAIHDLEAKIADLEAQLAAAGGGPAAGTTVLSVEDQASVDAMAVTLDSQSANLEAGAAAAEANLNPPAPVSVSASSASEAPVEAPASDAAATAPDAPVEAPVDASAASDGTSAESETPEEEAGEPVEETAP
jgi:hypothetical protein